MVYQGSKSRIASELIPIIQSYIKQINATTYVELFVGGANVIDKVKCKERIGVDYNHNLIALLNYAKSDPNLSIAPEDCSFDHYSDVRANQTTGKYTDEYVALIGYMASYGGRYFDGGYGRDSKGGRTIYKERLANLKQQASQLDGIDFIESDYKNFPVDKYFNCVFYLDPPYRDTKEYAKNEIDYDEFYDFCVRLSQDNVVLISEYYMPDDRFKCIWEKEIPMLQKSDRVKGETRTEKLFMCKNSKTNDPTRHIKKGRLF